ncbi:hypothetical protein CK203_033799 [Vitis vinifera]|uniref:Reverse transcriptase Ty1/copia-type domain-containing protein n=1 Tax=Vitis vinifera TaxID=29760 RepID=A0A438IQI7_VITVI|nr:hypothetical protein CK203_033799 [Vitis vinifera]
MGKIVILIVYVDDMILTRDDKGKLEEGNIVSQRKYVLKLLEEVGLLGCKPVETPMEPNLRLQSASADKVVNWEQFQSIIGRRPTLAYCTFIEGNLVIWRHKKQTVMAKSQCGG